MAINDFKNIEQINLNLDSTAQLVNSKDLNIFKSNAKNVIDFGMSKNDVIEFRIYDVSNNLLEQTEGQRVRYITKSDMPKYLKEDIDPKTQEKIFDIDVEKLIRESGYGNGEFKVSFNFVKNVAGTQNKLQRVWIHEVSPSRTEIRVMPLLTTDETQNKKITTRYNAFIEKAPEFRFVVDLIKKKMDILQLQISDLIDNFLINKFSNQWLEKVKKDFQFGNDQTYTAFKVKIFSDFKKLVYDYIDAGNFDYDEFYTKGDINTFLANKLSESIELNSKKIAQYEIPQVIKNESNQKPITNVLQSLLDTNYTAKSNLTQTNKLGVSIRRPQVVIETPKPKKEIIRQLEDQPPVREPQPVGGGRGRTTREAVTGGRVFESPIYRNRQLIDEMQNQENIK